MIEWSKKQMLIQKKKFLNTIIKTNNFPSWVELLNKIIVKSICIIFGSIFKGTKITFGTQIYMCTYICMVIESWDSLEKQECAFSK